MAVVLAIGAALASGCDSGETPSHTPPAVPAPTMRDPAPPTPTPSRAPSPTTPPAPAPPAPPALPPTVSWHGTAAVRADRASDRGRPRFRIEADGTCLDDGDCLVPDGFPAVRTDGTELVVAVRQAFIYDSSTPLDGHTVALAALALPDLRVTRVLPLVERTEVMAHHQTLSDCCGPSEDDCDPYLCEPSPRLVNDVSREVRSTVAGRLREANEYLRAAQYRVLAPLPAEGADPAAAMRFEVDETGETTVVVRARDASRVRFESSFPMSAERPQADTLAWHDAATGLFLAEVAFPTEGEEDYGGVVMHYVAGVIGP